MGGLWVGAGLCVPFCSGHLAHKITPLPSMLSVRPCQLPSGFRSSDSANGDTSAPGRPAGLQFTLAGRVVGNVVHGPVEFTLVAAERLGSTGTRRTGPPKPGEFRAGPPADPLPLRSPQHR